MTLTAIGDLAQGFALRLQQAELKQSLGRLGKEVTEGRVADPLEALGGHLSHLSQLEHDLPRAESFGASAREVAVSAAAMQTALARVGDLSQETVGSLALAVNSAGPPDLTAVAARARGALESQVSALNTAVAGRYLFSGTRVETPPLESADRILAELGTAISGAASPADAVALAEDFFAAPGGGFETAIYGGSTDSLAPVRLGSGESADLDLRADHAAFRDSIMHVALAALADDPTLSLDQAGRNELIGNALNGLLAARNAQAALQADLGVTEARIERARSRLESEVTTMRLARNELLAVDPFEAATNLEEVRGQLETLYAVTARSSRLSLVNFLS